MSASPPTQLQLSRLTRVEAGAPPVFYGSCLRLGSYWVIECEAHVMMRIKRWFSRVDPFATGQVRIKRTPEVDRDLQALLDRHPLEMSEEDVHSLHLGAEQHRAEAKLIAKVAASDFVARDFELAIPLRDYQRVAADLGQRLRTLLIGDDLGIGKTIEAIAWFSDPAFRPVLVVTPGGAVPAQWEKQVLRCLPEARTHILRGQKPYDLVDAVRKEDRAAGKRRPPAFPDAIISPYTRINGWPDVLGPKLKAMVLDECKSLRHGGEGDEEKIPLKWKAARAFRTHVQNCIGLDATPQVNYASEAWPVFEIIRPGSLGSESEFHREWCHRAGRHWLISDPTAFGFYLRESGLLLRRTRKEVGREMPPITVIPHHIEANVKALDSVKGRAAELARTILRQGGGGSAFQLMRDRGEFTRILRQATGISKAPFIADFVRMLVEQGERPLVGLWHRSVYDILNERLADYKPANYSGEESTKQKRLNLERFLDRDTPILCMSLRSGEAIDGLQHVSQTVVIGELDWSKVIHDQFIGRIDRDGQAGKVIAYFLLASVGSDPVVSDICGAKQANTEPVRNPDPNMIAPVETDPAHVRKLAEAYLAGASR